MASRTYLQLVRENREFRQLWIASVISMLGEWFNTIALFFLILEYTGSEFLLGLLFTVRMAGFAILQPFIGLMADRYNRKMLMVVSNLMQAGFALCFLFVERIKYGDHVITDSTLSRISNTLQDYTPLFFILW